MRFTEFISEAGSPAQQAAIAIAMKKAGKKPKDVAESSPNADVKKQISKFEELALAANRAGDDAKCKQYQQKIQSLKQKMSRGVAEGLDDNGISFQVQKGKNKFATTLSMGNNPVGVYQYNATTGRSIAEVYPEFKGKGLGKLLVLHAIYTATQLGLDFQEDESRTSEYDNVLDSLSSNGYIVDDDGYWYVTGEGEQYLKQSLKQGVAEDKENYNGINILLQKDDDELFVKASAGSRELGHVLFVIDGEYLMPQDLEVEEKFRGQGIAQTMYDYVKSKGYKIRRSGQQTDAGAGFWDKHRPEQNVWEQGVAEGSDMLSLDDKIKIYSKHKSQAQQAENRGDYTTADKHKKQASKIYSNIVNLHFGDDGKDAQNAANEYIRKSQGVAEEKKPEFMKAGNMKPFKVSGEEIPGAVHTLEKLLLKAKERNIKLNYTNIDKMMQSVCKKHNLTGDELHNEFVEKNHMIPDDWIVKQLDEACWSTHKQVGMKNKSGKQVPNCVPKESIEATEQVLENLHKWFKEKWVRFGPDGKIRGDCARGSESEGKPKCLPQSKAHSLGKKGRASAASRKRREDPNANRSGKAINVSTKGKGK
jgi:GNAT superfamily N-acetyltransferase